MFRNSGAEKIEKNKKSHFCDNLVPARPENFWARGVNMKKDELFLDFLPNLFRDIQSHKCHLLNFSLETIFM